MCFFFKAWFFKQCKHILVLSGGFEKGVAATKSVIEQALIYDSLIYHLAINQGKKISINKIKKELKKTGKIIRAITVKDILDEQIAYKLA